MNKGNNTDSHEALALAAQHIRSDFEALKDSNVLNVDRVYKCRSLLSRLSAAFSGLQCGANDKEQNPLHWEIMDYLETIKDEDGKCLALSLD